MMMQCFEAGGLEAVFNPARDKMRHIMGRSDEHYDPNSGGLYELLEREMKVPGFPREYEGKLIKVMYYGITNLVPGEYKVVFMRRHWDEVKPSFDAFFGGNLNPSMTEDTFQAWMDDYCELIIMRGDMELAQVWYDDVLDDPEAIFAQLAWPIDVEKAVQIIDPAKKRFCLEAVHV